MGKIETLYQIARIYKEPEFSENKIPFVTLPSFTIEKQLALFRLFLLRKTKIQYFEHNGFIEIYYNYNYEIQSWDKVIKQKTFPELVADLIINIWEELDDLDKYEVREIIAK